MSECFTYAPSVGSIKCCSVSVCSSVRPLTQECDIAGSVIWHPFVMTRVTVYVILNSIGQGLRSPGFTKLRHKVRRNCQTNGCTVLKFGGNIATWNTTCCELVLLRGQRSRSQCQHTVYMVNALQSLTCSHTLQATCWTILFILQVQLDALSSISCTDCKPLGRSSAKWFCRVGC